MNQKPVRVPNRKRTISVVVAAVITLFAANQTFARTANCPCHPCPCSPCTCGESSGSKSSSGSGGKSAQPPDTGKSVSKPTDSGVSKHHESTAEKGHHHEHEHGHHGSHVGVGVGANIDLSGVGRRSAEPDPFAVGGGQPVVQTEDKPERPKTKRETPKTNYFDQVTLTGQQAKNLTPADSEEH